ncbi:MAG: 4-hydroxy-tetrahydrodipicolinate synthase [Desulfobacterales bacterium]|jgi:4-hydroxy-tetrahydrodipicolinate synthase|nr:4-hydroxy-tetrahydrodipicolinate synthase [Desulfobacterales bacterium]MDD3080826.1 4-hydroxy-tetrahydrodipicolinate synthase [Desulfobacterales bacterium]MDD3950090.1 4-hydroxy-tetrahydrodipicolinate synthase [Desulfobacterales bacterium]MDD4464360.1 4-hydroxy-tetrahydrodipicolinate synthase [Desulfobacterales bacterium]MDY0376836.1 4-hydroxy-tetrahydrodipicolinate synthase [Desulfobacterales bacterium]
MLAGCFTALITPFKDESVDYNGLERIVEFQLQNRISGILAAGTTGESPSLTWDEHNAVIETVSRLTRNRCICIAGTGSNNTAEALNATRHAVESGVQAVLVVDPYYNGPGSLEIRREYIEPMARAFPNVEIIPYIIPGRTGTQLLPEDLALLHKRYANVKTVKEATGSLDNMKRTRFCCGPGLSILSGDDALTCEMIQNPEIAASGVISVVSNIAPGPVGRLVALAAEKKLGEASDLMKALQPLFDLVTVKTTESTPMGPVMCRARNPLPIKTLMALLGMPGGKCRPPLGRMTMNGFNKVVQAARSVQDRNPEILRPVAEFFGVDIETRLTDPDFRHGLYYEKPYTE